MEMWQSNKGKKTLDNMSRWCYTDWYCNPRFSPFKYNIYTPLLHTLQNIIDGMLDCNWLWEVSIDPPLSLYCTKIETNANLWAALSPVSFFFFLKYITTTVVHSRPTVMWPDDYVSVLAAYMTINFNIFK